MKVLYASHTALVSGAEHSLLGLLGALPPDVVPLLAVPPGPLADLVAALGVAVAPLPAIDVSLKPHLTGTPLGIARLAAAAVALRRLARGWSADLIHANSVRAGIPAVGASRMTGIPVVVHVRDSLPDSAMARAARRAVREATCVIANSRHTAERFGPARRVEVIHNAVDLARFNPALISATQARRRLGISGKPVLGMIAQITPWKAQSDAITVLAEVRRLEPDAHLVIVGEPKFTGAATRHDNAAYRRDLTRQVAGLGLDNAVTFLGERDDVPEIIAALDLLLMPSWDEPFGRSAIEAMAMGVPVIATSIGGPAEFIEDGVDGILLPPRDPHGWGSAVSAVLADRLHRRAMGRAARAKAVDRFGLDAHVGRVVDLYRHIAGGRR